jgi:hypothetical protein
MLVLCSLLLEYIVNIIVLSIILLDSSINNICGIPIELSSSRGSNTKGL